MAAFLSRFPPPLRWLLLSLPCAILVWALQLAHPDHWTLWVLPVAVAQLILGDYARRRLFGPPFSLGGPSGWIWALAAVAILQGSQWALAVHQTVPLPPLFGILTGLFNMVVLVGLVEELWFRGLWFRVMARHPLAALVSGSLLFSLYHWPQGLHRVVLTFAIGMVLGAARLRGASLLALALVHGGLNWLNEIALPATGLRMAVNDAVVAYALICLAGSVLLMSGSKGNRDTGGL